MKTKPQRPELEALVDKLMDPPTDLVRRDKFFKDKGFKDTDVDTPEKVVAVLEKYPRLLQRPVVVVDNKAMVARPKDRVLELL